MPRVYVIRDKAPNAFATGRDPEHAAVAITTGLRNKLSREELQGVIAHEMAHIQNHDIRLMLLTTVLVGTVVLLTDLFWQMIWYAPVGDSEDRDREDENGGDWKGLLRVVLVIFAVLLAIIAPLLAQLLRMALSRQREFLADASAVKLTRYPLGLASALRKISDDPAELRNANRGTAPLYIVNPIKKIRAGADAMFSSHPPIEERIQRLEALDHTNTIQEVAAPV
jgi:heat shock protein HtpX